jgi:hypothetical protein
MHRHLQDPNPYWTHWTFVRRKHSGLIGSQTFEHFIHIHLTIYTHFD